MDWKVRFLQFNPKGDLFKKAGTKQQGSGTNGSILEAFFMETLHVCYAEEDL
jgi:hypothetical protein